MTPNLQIEPLRCTHFLHTFIHPCESKFRYRVVDCPSNHRGNVQGTEICHRIDKRLCRSCRSSTSPCRWNSPSLLLVVHPRALACGWNIPYHQAVSLSRLANRI